MEFFFGLQIQFESLNDLKTQVKSESFVLKQGWANVLVRRLRSEVKFVCGPH